MKKTYYISVTEMLNKVVAVEAEDLEEAFNLVEGATNSGEVELTADDFVDRSFTDETDEIHEMIDDGVVGAEHYQKIIIK